MLFRKCRKKTLLSRKCKQISFTVAQKKYKNTLFINRTHNKSVQEVYTSTLLLSKFIQIHCTTTWLKTVTVNKT